MMKIAYVSLVIFLLAASAAAQTTSNDETTVWGLERSYWEYVKANDLQKYRALWHENFVGWPQMSATPVHKDHITDWITSNTSKGLKMESYTLEPLAIEIRGDVAITHYRIKDLWTDDKGGVDKQSGRITHTWIRMANSWEILGGMSSPLNAEGK